VAAALCGVRSWVAFNGVRWRAALADLREERQHGGPNDGEAGRKARRGARLEELGGRGGGVRRIGVLLERADFWMSDFFLWMTQNLE
jgi:hypothetical protein